MSHRLSAASATRLTEQCTAGGTDVVYVIGRGAPERRAVTIERRNADRVAIKSGLEPGEKVALEDPTVEGRK